jgi:hypothetical protein
MICELKLLLHTYHSILETSSKHRATEIEIQYLYMHSIAAALATASAYKIQYAILLPVRLGGQILITDGTYTSRLDRLGQADEL